MLYFYQSGTFNISSCLACVLCLSVYISILYYIMQIHNKPMSASALTTKITICEINMASCQSVIYIYTPICSTYVHTCIGSLFWMLTFIRMCFRLRYKLAKILHILLKCKQIEMLYIPVQINVKKSNLKI